MNLAGIQRTEGAEEGLLSSPWCNAAGTSGTFQTVSEGEFSETPDSPGPSGLPLPTGRRVFSLQRTDMMVMIHRLRGRTFRLQFSITSGPAEGRRRQLSSSPAFSCSPPVFLYGYGLYKVGV